MKILYLHWVEITPQLCKIPSVTFPPTCTSFGEQACHPNLTRPTVPYKCALQQLFLMNNLPEIYPEMVYLVGSYKLMCDQVLEWSPLKTRNQSQTRHAIIMESLLFW